MQNLQDVSYVTVNSDNKWDNNHVVSCYYNFLKYVLRKVVLFSIVAFKTLAFHKVV